MELRGVWKTSHPRYEAIHFELQKDAIVLHAGEGRYQSHRIEAVTSFDAAPTHAFGGLLETRNLDIREDDVHPFVGEALGEGAAHAARRAGDDGRLACKVLHLRSMSRRNRGIIRHI
jgi:hypothetical protein